MEYIGYAGALIMGLVLGLIGGGGSILTVPIFVYLFGIKPVQATSYSLVVVGFSALYGVLHYLKNGLLDMRTALYFGFPSILAVFITRSVLLPYLPAQPIARWPFLTKDVLIMSLFAVLMIAASYTMIKPKSYAVSTGNVPSRWLIIAEGVVVGVLTGLVGAGGGFLIVPALVVLAGLPMKEAVATSLLIIAMKSLIGVLGDLFNPELQFDAGFLALFTALSFVGVQLGTMVSKKISANELKVGFGWFVLVSGTLILLKELL